MNYRQRLQYYLVKHAGISHKQAIEYITGGKVHVDDVTVTENIVLSPYSKVVLNQHELSKTSQLVYIAYYKPVGIECTLNENIAGNLQQQLSSMLPPAIDGSTTKLFYAGRLDKASEGLLLLTNDGHLYNKIIAPKNHLAKEYEVQLEKPYNNDFIVAMQNGVAILNTITAPCRVEPIDETLFKITLTQGMNRQIRRMCFALGNYVIKLKRISIGAIFLGALNPAEFRSLNSEEINYLQNL